MGAIPWKAQELEKLCLSLQREGIHYYAVAPGRRGQPDLVVGGAVSIAVWLRRADLARPLTNDQQAQIEKAASHGWDTLIAFGARDALQELHRKGVAARRGEWSSYAVAPRAV